MQYWPGKGNAKNQFINQYDSRKSFLYQNKNNSNKYILKSLPNFLSYRKSDYSKKIKNSNAEQNYNILYSNVISKSFYEK